MTHDDQVIRAAPLLLGADTSAYSSTPHPAQMTWKLVGEQRAHEYFRPPFLLNTTVLAKCIRNVQPRLLPPGELIYREISKYDERSPLEALCNCIMHQDYARNSRIVVTEYADHIAFKSVGEFFDGVPDGHALGERTPRQYRSPFLVEAMTELNLIDQMGYGIHRMVQNQVRRFLPLPGYDLSTIDEVKPTISDAVIDKSYSRLLMVHTDLPLEDVLTLDRVQKGPKISERVTYRLRRVGLIGGRKPHRWIIPHAAAATGAMTDYIRTRPQADAHYAAFLTDFLRVQGYANRGDAEALPRPTLSEAPTEQQKATKITNLLTKLRCCGVIINRGTRTRLRWELSYAGNESVQSKPPRKKGDDASGTARGSGSARAHEPRPSTPLQQRRRTASVVERKTLDEAPV